MPAFIAVVFALAGAPGNGRLRANPLSGQFVDILDRLSGGLMVRLLCSSRKIGQWKVYDRWGGLHVVVRGLLGSIAKYKAECGGRPC